MSLTQSDLMLDSSGAQMPGVQHSGSRLNNLQLTDDGCVPMTVGVSSLPSISAPPPSEPSIPAASSSAESEMKTRGRRVRNPTQWRRAQRKLSRVAGKQYLGTHGRLVAPRQMGPDCRCSSKCYTRVDAETRQAMFSGFYALASYDEQNAYLYGLIVKKDVSVKRKSKSASERRVCHYEYFARDRGRLIQICKTAFANIHGISFKKIRTLCQKLDMNVLFPRDQRGKHDNRPSKITEQMKEGVRRHINSILQPPISRRFIRSSASGEFCLNIAKMHEDYRQRHSTTADPVSDGVCETDKPVKMWIYSKIFNAEFRLNVQVSFLECAADGSAPSGQQQNHQRSNVKKRARVVGVMAPSSVAAVAAPHLQPPSDTLLAPPSAPSSAPSSAPPSLPPSHLQQSDGGGKLVMSQLQMLEPSPVTPAAQQLVCLPLGCAVELQAQPLDLHQHQHQHVYAVHQHHQHYQLTLDMSSAAQPLAEWALDSGH